MKLRVITTTGVWALGDQVLSTATNFAAGIVVARTVGPSGYGSFTLAFGTWVILLGTTRAMLVQPFTVAASGAPDDEWRNACGATAAAVLMFGIVFGAAAVVAGLVIGSRTATGSAFVALGFFAAPLALQDFWRFAAFSQVSPRSATFNDGVWAIAQAIALVGLLILHRLTPSMAIASWGFGALAGALYGFQQFRVRPSLGAAERRFIQRNAALAGWFGVSNASYQAGSYGAILLVGAGAGAASLGGLSSAANLISPIRIVVSSGESIMLPAVARAAREPRSDRFRILCKTYSLGFALFFAVTGAVLIMIGPWALQLLFGAAYVRFAPLIAPTVAGATLSGLASGLILGFRALGEGRRLAILQGISSFVRIVIVALSLRFGLLAIAWGFAAAEALRTTLAWLMFGKSVSLAWGGRSDFGIVSHAVSVLDSES